MERTAKIAISGLVIGCVIAGLSVEHSARLNSKLESARAECVAEGKREANTTAIGKMAAKYRGKLDCDPASLQQNDVRGNNAQNNLLQAYQEQEAWSPWPILVGILTTFISALPWLWYFILRRLAEIRQALLGK